MSTDVLGLDSIVYADEASASAVRSRAAEALRPAGAIARLDEIAVWLASWQRTTRPAVEAPALVIFGGDHGVAAENVSAYPSSVTAAMMDALHSGVATASVMARQLGASIHLVDVGVGNPTGNLRIEPALSEPEFEQAVSAGRQAVRGLDAPDLLLIGEIGIANTTAAAAVSLALFGGEAGDWVGPGTGLDSRALANKRRVVSDAVARGPWSDHMDVICQLGGWEMAAIAGAVIEARHLSLPVLLDGFVVTSSVMPLEMVSPGYLDHCWPAHVSGEPGHRRLVRELGRSPLLDLGLRLGEGSGALAALPIVSLAARTAVDVATFREWGLG